MIYIYRLFIIGLLLFISFGCSKHKQSEIKPLCGNYLPHYEDQPKLDSQRLASPDGKYNVVMQIGEGDASYFWIEEVDSNKSFGKDSSAFFDMNGVCWDPNEPILYYSISPIYGSAGIYKWSFLDENSRPVRLDEMSSLEMFATKEPLYELKAIDSKEKRLLILLLYTDLSGQTKPFDKYYVLDIADGSIKDCEGCTEKNWVTKAK